MNKKHPYGIWILLLIAAIIFTACSAQAEGTIGDDTPAPDRNEEDVADHDEEGVADHDEEDVADHDEEDVADHDEEGAADHDEEGAADHDEEGAADHDGGAGHVEVPAEFADLSNPFADSREAIEAGEMTYNNLCASCHGENGGGDGSAAASLTPPPAKLSDGAMMSLIGDDYLFWRISKGGAIEPFNSTMPAWEGALTEEQRWQVVSYIRILSDG